MLEELRASSPLEPKQKRSRPRRELSLQTTDDRALAQVEAVNQPPQVVFVFLDGNPIELSIVLDAFHERLDDFSDG